MELPIWETHHLLARCVPCQPQQTSQHTPQGQQGHSGYPPVTWQWKIIYSWGIVQEACLITGGYFVFHGYPDVIYMYACMYVCMYVCMYACVSQGSETWRRRLECPISHHPNRPKKKAWWNTSALTGSKSDHNRIFNLQTKVPATPTIAARLQLEVVMAEFKGQRI